METITLNLATGPNEFKLIASREVGKDRFVVYKDGQGYTCAWLTLHDCFVHSKFTFVLDDAIDCLNKSVEYAEVLRMSKGMPSHWPVRADENEI